MISKKIIKVGGKQWRASYPRQRESFYLPWLLQSWNNGHFKGFGSYVTQGGGSVLIPRRSWWKSHWIWQQIAGSIRHSLGTRKCSKAIQRPLNVVGRWHQFKAMGLPNLGCGEGGDKSLQTVQLWYTRLWNISTGWQLNCGTAQLRAGRPAKPLSG